jgi:two-component system, NtrC family, response regulator AtoC
MIDKILVVDDEPLIRSFLEEALIRKGYQVEIAKNGKEAFAALLNHTFDLVITDMKMPDVTGLDVLKKAKELHPKALSFVMTAFGTIDNAVEAMQIGAFHYLLKPFTPDALFTLLKKAQEHAKLVQENAYLRTEVNGFEKHPLIVKSTKMQQILEEAKRVAKSQANVFIHGESGTGKEVLASTLHRHSLRAQSPYIRVNCAAIPDTLVESEFFGHEKGSFTGATTKRIGRFELADKGTLLLDEVTEIPIDLQPKLLRVLQEREFERVGGARTLNVDVRIIATSNRDLKEAIKERIFREDLYYRLNVIPFYLPPLRERKEDILPIAEHYIEKFSKENRKAVLKISPKAKKKLLDYDWPGNIRELANTMERSVVLAPGDLLEPEKLYF